MKNFILTIATLLLLYANRAYSQITYTVNVDAKQIKQTVIKDINGNNYTQISYQDFVNGSPNGFPHLPCVYLQFIVPNNAKNFSIKSATAFISFSPVNIQYPLQITQITPTNDKIVAVNSKETSTFSDLNPNNYYPEELYSIVDEGFFDGNKHIITVRVNPFRYKSNENQLTLHSSLSFTINWETGTQEILQPLPSIKPLELNALNFVTNKSDIIKYAPAKPSSPIKNNTGVNLPFYEYLIVTTDKLANTFQRLVEWKRMRGLDAGVVSIEQILSNPNITGDEISGIYDDAGKLRQYLSYAYQNGTRYVLIGGNDRIMPIRYGRGLNNGNKYNIDAPYDDAAIPSDLYFSDLNGNWNKDKDNYYGEATEDAVDYFPELFVGRLLVKNSQEVNNYIDKLLIYESNPGKGDYSYLQNAFYTQCDQLQRDNDANRFADAFMTVFPNVKIMEEKAGYNATITNEAECFPKGKDVIDAMNEHLSGFVSWSGHGAPIGIGTSNSSINNRPRFNIISTEGERANKGIAIETGNGLDNLKNKNYPGIAYTEACETAPFDIMYPEVYKNIKHNMAESYTVGGEYGGVAYLASTRYGWVGASSQLELKFINQIKNGHYSLGEAEALSKANNHSMRHWLSLAHNLIGCPELQIWTDIPSHFLNVTTTSFLNGTTVETGVEDCTIAVKGLFSGETNLQNLKGKKVTFKNVPKNYMIIVSKHNFLPYIAPVLIQNEEITGKHQLIANEVYAGRNVDNGRTSGDAIIKTGASVTINASGSVNLKNGFTVEKGATLIITKQ